MKRNRLFFGLTLVMLLVACGGGDAINYYGSIAINKVDGKAGIVANNSTGQPSANNDALNQCASKCETVLEYGNGMCGALSRSLTAGGLIAFGWASASVRKTAEDNAISQCIKLNGVNCIVSLSMCNG